MIKIVESFSFYNIKKIFITYANDIHISSSEAFILKNLPALIYKFLRRNIMMKTFFVLVTPAQLGEKKSLWEWGKYAASEFLLFL